MLLPKPLLSPLLPLLPLLTSLPTLAQQTRCQWSTLRSATDQVLESLTAGITGTTAAGGILLASPSLIYTQNSVALSIASPDSVLSAPLDVAFAHSIVDQDGCAGFVRIVVLPSSDGEGGGKGVLVIGAQIFYNYTFNQGTTVRQIDLVFAREGDWQMPEGLNATALLGHVAGEDWGALSRARQDSRAVLEGVAGTYLDFVGGTVNSDGNGTGTDSEAAVAVPWGRPCSRLEGSVYTAVGDAESCEKGLSPMGGTAQGITGRQFVVDESIGAVSVLARDGKLGGAPGVFEFRVVEGKLRYVHQFAATGLARMDD
ncbi:hypothetical protein C8A01DRAFT_16619 [Parachaetomium inaequale]|uniref:DUF8021 domain-containing protein n=1 Tax=Parachaetomium inaequale TaxID=2588326 RepID=A0AAN6SRJ7_9PEZI|nr:hypothetical protein C8A01DRAFT_16619 [Parachaetomium inaequale]